jgi:hypothetical protein
MINLEYELNNLYNKTEQIKRDNVEILTDQQLKQLNNLLEGTSKQDPIYFYDMLRKYKTKSNTLLNDFYTELENDKKFLSGTTILTKDSNNIISTINKDTSINYNCDDSYNCNNNMLKDIPYDKKDKLKILELKYKSLQNNIEIIKQNIRAERVNLSDSLINMQNNEHFATTLNSDYSEIYKYKYLKNWGIFLSIMGGAYFVKKLK